MVDVIYVIYVDIMMCIFMLIDVIFKYICFKYVEVFQNFLKVQSYNCEIFKFVLLKKLLIENKMICFVFGLNNFFIYNIVDIGW